MKLFKGLKNYQKGMKKYNLIKLINFNKKQQNINNLIKLKLKMNHKSIIIKMILMHLMNIIYIKQLY